MEKLGLALIERHGGLTAEVKEAIASLPINPDGDTFSKLVKAVGKADVAVELVDFVMEKELVERRKRNLLLNRVSE